MAGTRLFSLPIWTMPTSAKACSPGTPIRSQPSPCGAGDFSSLLDTSSQIGTDALGRPVYQGEIFNPASTRLVNGIPVRDGYGFDPVTGLPHKLGEHHSRCRSSPQPGGGEFDQVDPSPGPMQAFRLTVLASTYGDPTKELDPTTWLVRIDHEFTPTFKMSHTFFLDSRPSIRNCGDVGGCNTKFDPTDGAAKKHRLYWGRFLPENFEPVLSSAIRLDHSAQRLQPHHDLL